MLPEWKTASVIKKHDSPVLTYKDIPYPATCVFNAGVARYEGKYVMVFRNDVGAWGKCGMCVFRHEALRSAFEARLPKRLPK